MLFPTRRQRSLHSSRLEMILPYPHHDRQGPETKRAACEPRSASAHARRSLLHLSSLGSSPGTFTWVVAVDPWSTRISIGPSISSCPISTAGLNTEGALSFRGLNRHPLRPGTLSSLIGNTVTVLPRMQSRRK